MDLSSKLLPPQSRLVNRTGRGATEIFAYDGKSGKHGESLQRKNDLGTRPILNLPDGFQVLPQAACIHHITRGGQFGKWCHVY